MIWNLFTRRKVTLASRRKGEYTRTRHYCFEIAYGAYCGFWLWAWYGIVDRGSFPLALRIVAAVALFLGTPTEAPFMSYERASKDYAKWHGSPETRENDGDGG